MIRILITITIVLCPVLKILAQESCASTSSFPWEWPSHNNWFFGNGQLASFDGGFSITNIGSSYTSYEGTLAASDDKGNLLFFSNGVKLWDASGTQKYADLKVGKGGGTSSSAVVGDIVVKHPLNPDVFYVFTGDDAIESTNGLKYFEVDAGGNVLSGPTYLSNSSTTEGLAATKHANGVDIWLMSQKSGSNKFYAYQITCEGVQPTPVISSNAPNWTGDAERGGMAFSVDGTKFAVGHNEGSWAGAANALIVYSFDKSTGSLDNKLSVAAVAGAWGPINIRDKDVYDVCFSPDGSKVYYSTNGGKIGHYDLSSWNQSDINASWKVDVLSGGGHGALEIGSDGALYHSPSSSIRRLTGDLNSATGLSYSGSLGSSNLGLPTIYLPPKEEPDIQEVGHYCTSDPAVDLNTFWICAGVDAENPVDNPLAYTGIGITDRANGIFDPSVAGPGTHEITFEYCSVNDTIWITVTSCSSCTSNLEDIQPEICIGEAYSLDGLVNDASSTGVWSIDSFPLGTLPLITQPDGAIFDASNFQVADGIYKLLYTVTNGSGTCYDSVYIRVNPIPVVDLGNDTTICNGESIVFNPGAFNSYLWSDGTKNQTLNVNTAGEYWVKIEDSNGCIDRDSVVLIVADLPVVDLGKDTSVCVGNTVTFDASIFNSYLWNDGTKNQTLNVNTAGEYWVKIEDINGCSDTDTVVFSNYQLPIVDLGSDTSICDNESTITFDASEFDSYLWNDGSVESKLTTKLAGDYWVKVKDINGCADSDSIVLTINSVPQLNLGNDTAVCNGESVMFDVGSFHSILWNDGSIDPQLSATLPMDYWVRVEDINGCVNSDTIILSIYTLPMVYLGNDTSICLGDSVILNANVFDSYLWNDGSSDSKLKVNTPGVYWVKVEDSNGCQNNDSFELSINTLPTPDLGLDQFICEDSSGITFDPGVYDDYLWQPGGEVTQTINTNSAGQYIVQVTDENLCKGYDTVYLEVNDLPELNLGNDKTICPGSSVKLDAGSGYKSYFWSNASIEQEITVTDLNVGEFYVLVTDTNNCTDSDTIDVILSSELSVDLIDDTAICAGETVLIKSGYPSESYTFNWSNNEKTNDIIVETSGKYLVVVEDATGCMGLDSLVVTVNTLPVVDLGTDKEICEGVNLLLDVGSGRSSVIWNTSDTTPSIIAKLEGEYSVLVTNENGCEASDTIALIINSNPIPNLGNDQTLCSGSIALFEAGSYTNIIWHDQSEESSYSSGVEGEVRVTVTDDKGCIGSDTANVFVRDELFVNIGEDISICEGEIIELKSGYSAEDYLLSWSTNEKNANIMISDSGSYNVDVTDQHGCSGKDTIHVSFHPKPTPIVNDTAICEGELATLYTGYYASYSWNSGEDTREITSSLAGEYTVTVTNEEQCSGSAKGTLIVHSKPIMGTYETQVACEGETITLLPELPLGTYEWKHDGTSESILDVYSDGEYEVVVTNSFGCKDSMILEAVFTTKPEIDLGDNKSICEGDTANIGFNSEVFSLSWENGMVEDFINVYESGRYIAAITDSIGCVNYDTIDVFVSPIPSVNITNDTSVCMDEIEFLELTADAYGREEVIWSTGEYTNEIIIEEEGVYEVTITNEFGCVKHDTINVNRKCVKSIFVPSGFTPNEDGINDEFGPVGLNIYELEFYIFDRWGEQIFYSSDMNTKWDGTYMGIPCQIDVYVWKLSYKAEDELGIFRMYQDVGTVTLVR